MWVRRADCRNGPGGGGVRSVRFLAPWRPLDQSAPRESATSSPVSGWTLPVWLPCHRGWLGDGDRGGLAVRVMFSTSGRRGPFQDCGLLCD